MLMPTRRPFNLAKVCNTTRSECLTLPIHLHVVSRISGSFVCPCANSNLDAENVQLVVITTRIVLWLLCILCIYCVYIYKERERERDWDRAAFFTFCANTMLVPRVLNMFEFYSYVKGKSGKSGKRWRRFAKRSSSFQALLKKGGRAVVDWTPAQCQVVVWCTLQIRQCHSPAVNQVNERKGKSEDMTRTPPWRRSTDFNG